MGNVQRKGKENGLTEFQRRKLEYDFYTFLDLNHDGFITYKDFLWAKDKICSMSGWKPDSPKYKITEALFAEIWKSLLHIADVDNDGKITKAEWLQMWTIYKKEIMGKEKKQKDFLKSFYQHHKELDRKEHGKGGKEEEEEANAEAPVVLDSDEEGNLKDQKPEEPKPNTIRYKKKRKLMFGKNKSKSYTDLTANDGDPEAKVNAGFRDDNFQSVDLEDEERPNALELFAGDKARFFDGGVLPKWLYKYLVFRFNLLDRTGDNVVDNEEFEYVLSEFGVSEKEARQAFRIFTKNNTCVLDFDYFVTLFEEYYLSDDPSALGNFINGKLEFDGIESEDPGLLDHRANSSTSVHSMDDDLSPYKGKSKNAEVGEQAKNSSTIKLCESKGEGQGFMDKLRAKCCIG